MRRLLALIGCLLLGACASGIDEAIDALPPTVSLLSPSGTELSVQVDVADDASERAKGLMDRASLPPDTGMLFVFEEPQVLHFWMKNTLIPLDILFFDAGGDFVSFQEMEPCRADPCPTYSSFAEASYALEVPGGYAKTHEVGIGWKMRHQP